MQGAGHLAPRDQPERVTAMVGRFLAGDVDGLCDEEHGLCRASDVALASLGGRCALLYNCSDHGSCDDEGACACETGWAGADCAEAVHDVSDDAVAGLEGTFVVRPGGWQYHRGADRRSRRRDRARERVRAAAARRRAAVRPLRPRRPVHLPRAAGDAVAARRRARPRSRPLVSPRAWRVEGTSADAPVALPPLEQGALLGVANRASDEFGDYHAPSRAYTPRVSAAAS